MSTGLLISKILGLLVVGVGTVEAIAWTLLPTPSINEKLISPKVEKTEVYVISTGVNPTKENTVISNGKNKNYKCKIKSNAEKIDDNCVVKLIAPDSSHKGKLTLNNLKTIKGDDPTIAQLKQTTNYFQVKVTADFFSGLDWNNLTPNIEIIDSSDDKNILGNLKPVFGVNGTEVKGKAFYAVGKIKDFTTGSASVTPSGDVVITAESTTCLMTTDNTNDGVSCKIYKFSDGTESTLDELSFSGNWKNPITTLVKDKYYLFKFDPTTNSKEISTFKSDGTAKIKINPAASSPNSTITTIELESVVPATVSEESSSPFIFLIK